ncbi:MAG TPA: ABC transporter ATP-binding protein [Terriglobales bacterium]|nr:ABC transporter ATP-binding protein [Terriglobales bacterium]
MSRYELLNEKTNPADIAFDSAGAPDPGHATYATPAITLDSVTRHFGRFAALRGVSANFSSGRLYTVLGDNGAGKSTLLRIIAGLLQPTRGRVEVLGTTNLKSVRPWIGYMGHASLLYDELDAMENLRYFAGLYGILGNDGLCARAMTTVGLEPALKRRVGQYSQGMRQRLSLARAVLHDPKLLLLDEPFSNVDVASAHEMVRLLGAMRDNGKTVFLVTHQPSLLEGTADEFIHMTAGRIDQRDTRDRSGDPQTGMDPRPRTEARR